MKHSIKLNGVLNSEGQRALAETLPYFLGRQVNISFSGKSLVVESDNLPTHVELKHFCEQHLKDEYFEAEDELGKVVLKAGADPFIELCQRGDITSTGYGQYVYSGAFLDLFQNLDFVLRQFCLSKQASEELYPTLVKVSELSRAGYLSSFPHLSMFASSASYDQQHLDNITLSNANQVEVANLAPAEYMLAPTVCYHCFAAKQGKQLEPGVYTALNKCHRHEVANVRGLERLSTYWMRELMSFGSMEDVMTNLNSSLVFTTEFLRRLGVQFRVQDASDPFFASSASSKKKFYQMAFKLKQEILMPVHGGKWIAVASFNNHQATLTKSYSIASMDNTNELMSGCIGWGYERLLYAIICQLGLDPTTWSKMAREALNL